MRPKAQATPYPLDGGGLSNQRGRREPAIDARRAHPSRLDQLNPAGTVIAKLRQCMLGAQQPATKNDRCLAAIVSFTN